MYVLLKFIRQCVLTFILDHEFRDTESRVCRHLHAAKGTCRKAEFSEFAGTVARWIVACVCFFSTLQPTRHGADRPV